MSHAQQTHLNAIRYRYFWGNKIHHFGDCRIFRGLPYKFCSCGLLHDLEALLPMPYVKIIYPKYWDEFHLQEMQEMPPPKEQSPTKEEQLLEKVFGPIPKSSPEEIKMDYNEMKRDITEVFNDTFPSALDRLEEWYKNQLSS